MLSFSLFLSHAPKIIEAKRLLPSLYGEDKKAGVALS